MKSFTVFFLVFVLLTGCVTQPSSMYATATTTPLVAFMNDSFEPFNRTVHAVDEQLKRRIITPVSIIWEKLVPKCVRIGICNFVSNLNNILRIVTHSLGGRFDYAWTDIKRFGINTTIGLLGFMDPAAEKYGIYNVEGGFASTFNEWGIGQGTYMELPLMGGRSVRNQIGRIADILLNPVTFVIPYSVSYPIGAAKLISLYDTVRPTLTQLYLTSDTHYEKLKLYAYYSEQVEDTEYKYDADSKEWNPDDSLGYTMLGPMNELIQYTGLDRTLKFRGFGKITYTRWLVRNSNKLAIILPGIGTHRLDSSVLALAEWLNAAGISVASISSTMNPDFFEKLDDERPFGYVPEDAKMLARIVPAIVRDVENSRWSSSKVECSVVGYSLGALTTLFMASDEENGKLGGLQDIAHYIAVNPPVDALNSVKKLDEFFMIPEKNSENAEEYVRDIFMRSAAFLTPNHNNPVRKIMPLTHEESLFLIAANTRFGLANCVLGLQKKKKEFALLKEDGNVFLHRNALFAEALNVSFKDYMNNYVIPWYQNHYNMNREALVEKFALSSIYGPLRNNDRIYLFHSENDPLNDPGQVNGLYPVFGNRATIASRGGHLGNMVSREFAKKLIEVLLN